jgi:hypothetical protein
MDDAFLCPPPDSSASGGFSRFIGFYERLHRLCRGPPHRRIICVVYYAHSSIPVKELVLTTPQMSPPSTTLRERRHQRRAANQQMMPPADPAQGPLVAGSHASRPASRAQGAVGVASNLPISPVQGAVVGMSNPPTMASLDFFPPWGTQQWGLLVLTFQLLWLRAPLSKWFHHRVQEPLHKGASSLRMFPLRSRAPRRKLVNGERARSREMSLQSTRITPLWHRRLS